MKVELLKQIIEIGDPIEADTVTKSKDLWREGWDGVSWGMGRVKVERHEPIWHSCWNLVEKS